ncbi:MAG TPA: MBOAT family O-acyltransferase [Myxococcota bacterium]|nr:MBOAT family O-acyltransferase [Myxococcota bacterium]HRY95516.1 MBOAT family O-acyltransferase [Myxococcota bacterium]
MVFSSQAFLFWFLPIALGLYCVVPRRARHLALTLVSYAFYGWAGPLFCAVMLASTLLDYACGLMLVRGAPGGQLAPGGPRARAQRVWLAVSLAGNLGLLGFFKYANFGVDTWNGLVGALGFPELALEGCLRVGLPLGISFYTFQSLSYTLDVYRGRTPAMRSLVDFACFVSMFPQLIAGPILRFGEVREQLEERTHTLAKAARGAALVCLGLGKKVLLANACGGLADTVHGAGELAAPEAWLGAAAYTFQIYFDFSGYSDMAVGLGLLVGFTFPKNFDGPLRARSLSEHWRRWHLSLTTWLRDYVYIPLGGSRAGPARAARNVLLVMLLAGLWHGASWTFVLWGALHGLLLVAERWNRRRPLWWFLPGPLQTLATFGAVSFAFVLFRAPDLERALGLWRAMLGLGGDGPGAALVRGLVWRPHGLLGLGLAAAVAWFAPQAWDFTQRLPAWRVLAVLAVFVAAVAVLSTQAFDPFIYFIF